MNNNIKANLEATRRRTIRNKIRDLMCELADAPEGTRRYALLNQEIDRLEYRLFKMEQGYIATPVSYWLETHASDNDIELIKRRKRTILALLERLRYEYRQTGDEDGKRQDLARKISCLELELREYRKLID